MGKTIITISRQYGSAGREIAAHCAELLGVKLYDRQLIHIAAAQLQINNLSEQELLQLESEVPPLGLDFTSFFNFGMRGEKPLNQQIFDAESAVIARLAEQESCVILGRCANFVLADHPNTVNVFIHASDEYRKDYAKKMYNGIGLDALNREDKKRAAYYEHYTAHKFGSPRDFDLVIRADKGTPLQIASAITAYAQAFTA